MPKSLKSNSWVVCVWWWRQKNHICIFGVFHCNINWINSPSRYMSIFPFISLCRSECNLCAFNRNVQYFLWRLNGVSDVLNGGTAPHLRNDHRLNSFDRSTHVNQCCPEIVPHIASAAAIIIIIIISTWGFQFRCTVGVDTSDGSYFQFVKERSDDGRQAPKNRICINKSCATTDAIYSVRWRALKRPVTLFALVL